MQLTQDKFLCHVYARECHKYPPFYCLYLQLPYRVSEEPTTANGFRSPTPAILLPGEALELLLGAGLDRVQATNLLAGSSGQRPTSQDGGADQRNKAATSRLRIASSNAQCWRHWLSSGRDWTPSQRGSRAATPRVRCLEERHKRRSPAVTGVTGTSTSG